jgi:hypothetical protein
MRLKFTSKMGMEEAALTRFMVVIPLCVRDNLPARVTGELYEFYLRSQETQRMRM